MDEDFVARLLRFWDSRRIQYLNGLSSERITELERSKGLSLPNEVRLFYRATNGLRVPGTAEADERTFDFWPLEEVRRADPAPSIAYFADVLQSAYEYGFRVGESETAAVYLMQVEPVLIAPTFASFIDLYIRDDDSLYRG